MFTTGTIFDIKKFAIHDGPGVRTTIFLKGCPMDCWWCHNPEGGNGDTGQLNDKTRTVSVIEMIQEIEKDRIFYDQSGGGVTFSGGEPLAQPDFLTALLKACRSRGIDTAVDTCGFAPTEDFERVYSLTDMFLYDIKIIDSEMHTKYTGVSNSLVLKNLRFLIEKGSEVQVRIPLIPNVTDTEENLDAIAGVLKDLPGIRSLSLLPYNRFGEDKRRRYNLDDRLGKLPAQSSEEIDAVAQKFGALGFDVKIGG